MAFKIPPVLKATQLREVARLCGISRSGTKAILAGRIEEELSDFKPSPAGTKVLSIDLGIRNLAYSLLTVPELPQKPTRSKKTEKPTPLIPTLHAWERLSLIPRPPKKKKPKAKKGQLEDPLEEIDEQPEAKLSSSGFGPECLSAIAVKLVRERLLPLKPDIITIELQRARSFGGPAVFEWTLRVNSLESMLYAVLTTLRDVGHWHGDIETIAPRLLLGHLEGQDCVELTTAPKKRNSKAKKVDLDDLGIVLNDDQEGIPVKMPKAKDNTKQIKKDMVGRMLAAGTELKIADDALSAALTIQRYMDKWLRKPRPRASKSASQETQTEMLLKLDDLADSLLQGIVFIKWQENRKKLIDGGVEAIQDQMRD